MPSTLLSIILDTKNTTILANLIIKKRNNQKNKRIMDKRSIPNNMNE